MKIAFCSSEVFPFAKTGGLADVAGSLPIALEKIGVEVAVFMPGYRMIAKSGHQLEPLKADISRATLGNKINVYFTQHSAFFDHEGLYGDQNGDYEDNIERFGYFSDRVLKLCKEIDFKPDVVHCHDWQTALIPVLLKRKYADDPFYESIKSLLTIHNLAFQGVFPKEQFAKLELGPEAFEKDGFEFYGKVNLLKAGIIQAEKVTTVSPQYAKEIRSKEFGCGLEEAVRKKYQGVAGILNGLDYEVWDPDTDKHIAQKYSRGDHDQAKAKNKFQLQKELGLEVSEDRALMIFVGRLSHQKGIDLVISSAKEVIELGTQLAFLGQGDNSYEKDIAGLLSKFPGHIAANHTFDEAFGHQFYAGGDFLLMPSRFEPCGLSQMIALAYGTVPVVYKTGGLADTVKAYGLWNQDGNGIVFKKYTKEIKDA